jgi:hypothetical protein
MNAGKRYLQESYVYGRCIGIRESEQYFHENNHAGTKDRGFTVVDLMQRRAKFQDQCLIMFLVPDVSHTSSSDQDDDAPEEHSNQDTEPNLGHRRNSI